MKKAKDRSKLQEKRAAKDLGGKIQPGSGATPFYKGDVRADGLRLECKTTAKKSFSLSLAQISKIQLEALQDNYSDWAMQIQFEGTPGMNKRVAVLDWDKYLELRKDAEDDE